MCLRWLTGDAAIARRYPTVRCVFEVVSLPFSIVIMKSVVYMNMSLRTLRWNPLCTSQQLCPNETFSFLVVHSQCSAIFATQSIYSGTLLESLKHSHLIGRCDICIVKTQADHHPQRSLLALTFAVWWVCSCALSVFYGHVYWRRVEGLPEKNFAAPRTVFCRPSGGGRNFSWLQRWQYVPIRRTFLTFLEGRISLFECTTRKRSYIYPLMCDTPSERKKSMKMAKLPFWGHIVIFWKVLNENRKKSPQFWRNLYQTLFFVVLAQFQEPKRFGAATKLLYAAFYILAVILFRRTFVVETSTTHQGLSTSTAPLGATASSGNSDVDESTPPGVIDSTEAFVRRCIAYCFCCARGCYSS